MIWEMIDLGYSREYVSYVTMAICAICFATGAAYGSILTYLLRTARKKSP